jgi:hypothetical protein
MGILNRIQPHFSPQSSLDAIPEEPRRGLVISSPAPPTASQRAGRSSYFRFANSPGEDEGVAEDGLPTYNHLFPDGPHQWFREPRPECSITPARHPKDPRRLLEKEPRTIPRAVIDIMCKRVLDASSMAILARLNHSLYDTVIPHLYRKIAVDRFTLPKILYGIPLPISGFTFDPKAKFDAKGKQKQVYREEDVISRKVEERKRKCLEHVREIVLEEPLLDWRICQSLLILRDPGYGRDYSDTQPLGRYHPMREPEDPKEASPSRSIIDTTILMPNVETVYLTPGVIMALERWETRAKSPHILLDAVKALCGPKIQIITETTTTSEIQAEDESIPSETIDECEKTFEATSWPPFIWP